MATTASSTTSRPTTSRIIATNKITTTTTNRSITSENATYCYQFSLMLVLHNVPVDAYVQLFDPFSSHT